MTLPEWLTKELEASHPAIEIRWVDYPPRRKTFVLPLTGDAFYRMTTHKIGSPTVMHRRYLTATSDPKWLLGPLVYLPDADCAPSGRWVVFQKHRTTGEVSKVFDVVNDDGSLHPLDRRVIDAIILRDGAHEKALADVESEEERGDVAAFKMLEENVGDFFERVHHDVSKAIGPGGACVTADPNENDVEIVNH